MHGRLAPGMKARPSSISIETFPLKEMDDEGFALRKAIDVSALCVHFRFE
jgi:hypothetical protein